MYQTQEKGEDTGREAEENKYQSICDCVFRVSTKYTTGRMSSPTPPPSCEESSGGDTTPNKRQRTSLMRNDSDGPGATNVVEQEHRDKDESFS